MKKTKNVREKRKEGANRKSPRENNKNEALKKRKMSGKKQKKEPIENHMKPNNQIIK